MPTMRRRPATGRRRILGNRAPVTDIALVVGHAAWWKPMPQTAQYSLPPSTLPSGVSAAGRLHWRHTKSPTFARALRDFLTHVSFHCYARLVESGRRFEERFFWLVFHIAALCLLIVFLWSNYGYEGSPLTTTIFDALYPVERIAFPTVSICSINRISNASAWRYAEKLSHKDPLKRRVDFFYEKVDMLSNFYHRFDQINYEKLLEFQSFLDHYDTEDFEMFYNTRRHMKMLTPNCQHTLVHCRLGGQDFDCSTEFRQTLTAEGFCCTFNYDGKYSRGRPFNRRFFGSRRGLQVVLNASKTDYFYRAHRLEGFRVMIYANNNFPSVSSGAVSERYVLTGSDSHISIKPKILQTLEEIRYLGPKTRNCLFENELRKEFVDGYTFNKCITRCRINSILVLCQCVLFSLPYEYVNMRTQRLFCTLKHLQCLKRYNFKWLNVITQRKHVDGLEREMEDALYCPECLPSCTETTYTLRHTGQQLSPYYLRSYHKELREDIVNSADNNTDLALVRVYFGEPHAQYYQQILKDSWFEVFSNIGSICGLITGFSLIGIAEWLFFLTRQLYYAFRNEILAERKIKMNTTRGTEPLLILP